MSLSSSYHTLNAKKVIILVVLALLAIMLTGYGMLLYHIRQTQKAQIMLLLDDVIETLNDEIDEHKDDFTNILAKPKFQTIQYEFLIFSPTGQSFILSTFSDAEPLTLPNWQLAQDNKDTLLITRQGYEIWHRLHGGYSVYGVIRPLPLLPYIAQGVFLLPLGVTLMVFLIFLSYLSQYYRIWRELLVYSQQLHQHTHEAYQPLKLTYPQANREIAHMTQAMNRVGFQLHQYFKKVHHLTYRQQLLVESAPVALFLITRTGRITYFNQSFAQLFRTPYQAHAMYMLTDFITGSDKNTQQTLSKLANVTYLQTLAVTDLPRKQYFDLRLNPTYNLFGQLRGYSGSIETVDTYYHQIQQAWLNDKQQQERLAQFTKLWAVLGHELRTPLSGIIGMVALLNEEKNTLTREQQDLLASLTESSDSMLQLLNDMLDMAKMDAGKLQTHLSNTDILQLCRSVCGVSVGNARRKNIDFLYHTNPLIPRFMVTDEGRLRQILLNLINNAIKFTERGYVALLVDLVDKAEPIIVSKAFSNQSAQTWLKLTIKDTGMGISPHEQQKLFAYFNQANDTISQQFGGTGIGLALSNSFAQMLGGFIHLNSQVNEGSEFQVYLPLADYQPRLVFSYNTDPYAVHIFYFTAHAVSQSYVTAIFEKINLVATIKVGIDESIVEQINQIPLGQLQPVFIVDDLCYNQSTALFNRINYFKNATKILFSMQTRQQLSPNLLTNFDGFLQKPIYVSNFMAELLRIIQPNPSLRATKATMTAQQSFDNFLQKMQYNENKNQNLPIVNSIIDTLGNNSNNTLTSISKETVKNIAVGAFSAYPKKTVLIAEDNPVNQKIAQKQLEKMGYSVLIAENGQQAIDLLQANREHIVLVLMDCQMPVMDGLEATRCIRSSHDSIPIIALTANESDNERQQCLEAGMDNFLTKPLDKQALTKVLARYMI